MAYSFLLAGWEASVRRACGNVSSTDIPDALLADDLYAVDSEDFVKSKITDWAVLQPTKPAYFNRAAIFHIAAKVCKVLAKTQAKRVSIAGGVFTRELQQIDWEQEEKGNLSFCYANMNLAKSGVIPDLNIVVISSPPTPMFTDLSELDEELFP